jgi:c-di-GMP-binding flagellar brake protein YcgR
MHVPPGTQMLISREKTKAILGVVNLSLGGVLAALMKHNIPDLEGSLFNENEAIINAGILYPGDEELDEQIVIIQRAEVRRIEHDKKKRLYRYAFEFMHLAPPESKKLTQLIYHFQRMFLKRR